MLPVGTVLSIVSYLIRLTVAESSTQKNDINNSSLNLLWFFTTGDCVNCLTGQAGGAAGSVILLGVCTDVNVKCRN